MATLQNEFRKFHDEIKLKNYEENSVLREKRDIILDLIKENIKKNESCPVSSFSHFDQGSYAMHTGVIPVNGDYDIDEGLIFEIDCNDYSPLDVKRWVYDSVNGHTNNVFWKRPCITVQYSQKDEPIYHVDLAVYACDSNENHWLARGKQYSSDNEIKWEQCDPKELIKKIKEKLTDARDREQFYRIIRYLKYWARINFSQIGNDSPPGIGLTVNAYGWFQPNYNWNPDTQREYNDLIGLKELTGSLIDNWGERLQAILPVNPWNDLYSKMTDTQMDNFKGKLEKLRDTLIDVSEEEDEVEASKKLQDVWGDKFPVVEVSQRRKARNVSVLSGPQEFA